MAHFTAAYQYSTFQQPSYKNIVRIFKLDSLTRHLPSFKRPSNIMSVPVPHHVYKPFLHQILIHQNSAHLHVDPPSSVISLLVCTTPTLRLLNHVWPPLHDVCATPASCLATPTSCLLLSCIMSGLPCIMSGPPLVMSGLPYIMSGHRYLMSAPILHHVSFLSCPFSFVLKFGPFSSQAVRVFCISNRCCYSNCPSQRACNASRNSWFQFQFSFRVHHHRRAACLSH